MRREIPGELQDGRVKTPKKNKRSQTWWVDMVSHNDQLVRQTNNPLSSYNGPFHPLHLLYLSSHQPPILSRPDRPSIIFRPPSTCYWQLFLCQLPAKETTIHLAPDYTPWVTLASSAILSSSELFPSPLFSSHASPPPVHSQLCHITHQAASWSLAGKVSPLPKHWPQSKFASPYIPFAIKKIYIYISINQHWCVHATLQNARGKAAETMWNRCKHSRFEWRKPAARTHGTAKVLYATC